MGWQPIRMSAEKIADDMSEIGVTDLFQIVVHAAVRLGNRDQTRKIHGCGYHDSIAIDRRDRRGEIVEL